MTLIATGTGSGQRPWQSGDSDRVPCGSFFGEGTITRSGYRTVSRIDRTASDDQVTTALRGAIADIGLQLRCWVAAHILAGTTQLQDVAVDAALQAQDYYIERYRRAVHCAADALLCEAYADFDSSAEGHTRGEALNGRIEAYRRESNYAVADILGKRRSRIELL